MKTSPRRYSGYSHAGQFVAYLGNLGNNIVLYMRYETRSPKIPATCHTGQDRIGLLIEVPGFWVVFVIIMSPLRCGRSTLVCWLVCDSVRLQGDIISARSGFVDKPRFYTSM